MADSRCSHRVSFSSPAPSISSGMCTSFASDRSAVEELRKISTGQATANEVEQMRGGRTAECAEDLHLSPSVSVGMQDCVAEAIRIAGIVARQEARQRRRERQSSVPFQLQRYTDLETQIRVRDGGWLSKGERDDIMHGSPVDLDQRAVHRHQVRTSVDRMFRDLESHRWERLEEAKILKDEELKFFADESNLLESKAEVQRVFRGRDMDVKATIEGQLSAWASTATRRIDSGDVLESVLLELKQNQPAGSQMKELSVIQVESVLKRLGVQLGPTAKGRLMNKLDPSGRGMVRVDALRQAWKQPNLIPRDQPVSEADASLQFDAVIPPERGNQPMTLRDFVLWMQRLNAPIDPDDAAPFFAAYQPITKQRVFSEEVFPRFQELWLVAKSRMTEATSDAALLRRLHTVESSETSYEAAHDQFGLYTDQMSDTIRKMPDLHKRLDEQAQQAKRLVSLLPAKFVHSVSLNTEITVSSATEEQWEAILNDKAFHYRNYEDFEQHAIRLLQQQVRNKNEEIMHVMMEKQAIRDHAAAAAEYCESQLNVKDTEISVLREQIQKMQFLPGIQEIGHDVESMSVEENRHVVALMKELREKLKIQQAEHHTEMRGMLKESMRHKVRADEAEQHLIVLEQQHAANTAKLDAQIRDLQFELEAREEQTGSTQSRFKENELRLAMAERQIAELTHTEASLKGQTSALREENERLRKNHKSMISEEESERRVKEAVEKLQLELSVELDTNHSLGLQIAALKNQQQQREVSTLDSSALFENQVVSLKAKVDSLTGQCSILADLCKFIFQSWLDAVTYERSHLAKGVSVEDARNVARELTHHTLVEWMKCADYAIDNFDQVAPAIQPLRSDCAREQDRSFLAQHNPFEKELRLLRSQLEDSKRRKSIAEEESSEREAALHERMLSDQFAKETVKSLFSDIQKVLNSNDALSAAVVRCSIPVKEMHGSIEDEHWLAESNVLKKIFADVQEKFTSQLEKIDKLSPPDTVGKNVPSAASLASDSAHMKAIETLTATIESSLWYVRSAFAFVAQDCAMKALKLAEKASVISKQEIKHLAEAKHALHLARGSWVEHITRGIVKRASIHRRIKVLNEEYERQSSRGAPTSRFVASQLISHRSVELKARQSWLFEAVPRLLHWQKAIEQVYSAAEVVLVKQPQKSSGRKEDKETNTAEDGVAAVIQPMAEFVQPADVPNSDIVPDAQATEKTSTPASRRESADVKEPVKAKAAGAPSARSRLKSMSKPKPKSSSNLTNPAKTKTAGSVKATHSRSPRQASIVAEADTTPKPTPSVSRRDSLDVSLGRSFETETVGAVTAGTTPRRSPDGGTQSGSALPSVVVSVLPSVAADYVEPGDGMVALVLPEGPTRPAAANQQPDADQPAVEPPPKRPVASCAVQTEKVSSLDVGTDAISWAPTGAATPVEHRTARPVSPERLGPPQLPIKQPQSAPEAPADTAIGEPVAQPTSEAVVALYAEQLPQRGKDETPERIEEKFEPAPSHQSISQRMVGEKIISQGETPLPDETTESSVPPPPLSVVQELQMDDSEPEELLSTQRPTQQAQEQKIDAPQVEIGADPQRIGSAHAKKPAAPTTPPVAPLLAEGVVIPSVAQQPEPHIQPAATVQPSKGTHSAAKGQPQQPKGRETRAEQPKPRTEQPPPPAEQPKPANKEALQPKKAPPVASPSPVQHTTTTQGAARPTAPVVVNEKPRDEQHVVDRPAQPKPSQKDFGVQVALGYAAAAEPFDLFPNPSSDAPDPRPAPSIAISSFAPVARPQQQPQQQQPQAQQQQRDTRVEHASISPAALPLPVVIQPPPAPAVSMSASPAHAAPHEAVGRQLQRTPPRRFGTPPCRQRLDMKYLSLVVGDAHSIPSTALEYIVESLPERMRIPAARYALLAMFGEMRSDEFVLNVRQHHVLPQAAATHNAFTLTDPELAAIYCELVTIGRALIAGKRRAGSPSVAVRTPRGHQEEAPLPPPQPPPQQTSSTRFVDRASSAGFRRPFSARSADMLPTVKIPHDEVDSSLGQVEPSVLPQGEAPDGNETPRLLKRLLPVEFPLQRWSLPPYPEEPPRDYLSVIAQVSTHGEMLRRTCEALESVPGGFSQSKPLAGPAVRTTVGTACSTMALDHSHAPPRRATLSPLRSKKAVERAHPIQREPGPHIIAESRGKLLIENLLKQRKPKPLVGPPLVVSRLRATSESKPKKCSALPVLDEASFAGPPQRTSSMMGDAVVIRPISQLSRQRAASCLSTTPLQSQGSDVD